MKIQDSPIIYILSSVNSKLFTIAKKIGKENEFECELIAEKENPYKIVDLMIPKQEVSGASVSVPKKNGELSEYEKIFIKFLKNEKYRVVGKIHSHNSMSAFFSSDDERDINNYAGINTTNNLPYIDIVWNNENEFKAKIVLKLINNKNRQIIMFDEDNVEIEIEPVEIDDKLIDIIKKEIGKDFDIDKEKLRRAIIPKIEIIKELDNIKEKTEIKPKNWIKKSGIWYKEDDDDNEPKINFEYSKKKKTLFVSVWNDTEGKFKTEIEEQIADEDGFKAEIKSVFFGKHKSFYQIQINCENKDNARKLRKSINDSFEGFYDGWLIAQEDEDIYGKSIPRDLYYGYVGYGNPYKMG